MKSARRLLIDMAGSFALLESAAISAAAQTPVDLSTTPTTGIRDLRRDEGRDRWTAHVLSLEVPHDFDDLLLPFLRST